MEHEKEEKPEKEEKQDKEEKEQKEEASEQEEPNEVDFDNMGSGDSNLDSHFDNFIGNTEIEHS